MTLVRSDPEGDMAEVARTAVVLVRTPVVGQFDFRLRGFRRGQEHQGEPSLYVVLAPHLAQAEAIAVEAQGRIEVAHADHGVQIAHRLQSRNRSGSRGLEGSIA